MNFSLKAGFIVSDWIVKRPKTVFSISKTAKMIFMPMLHRISEYHAHLKMHTNEDPEEFDTTIH